jgi:hypothetical protein
MSEVALCGISTGRRESGAEAHAIQTLSRPIKRGKELVAPACGVRAVYRRFGWEREGRGQSGDQAARASSFAAADAHATRFGDPESPGHRRGGQERQDSAKERNLVRLRLLLEAQHDEAG